MSFSYLVSLSNFSNNILRRNLQIIKIECARRRCSNAQLLFLLGNLDTHIFCRNKASNTFVALARIYIRKDEENLCFMGVGDPHLGSIDDPIVAFELSAGLHSKCI